MYQETGAPEGSHVTLGSAPCFGLPHAGEQRVEAHAEDDHVFAAGARHGSHLARDAPVCELSWPERLLEDVGEYLRTHSRRRFMAAPYPMKFGGARQSRLFCRIHAHIPAQTPGAP